MMIIDSTRRWSAVVIGALKGSQDTRTNALRMIDADIASWETQIKTAKTARGYITDAIKADRERERAHRRDPDPV